MGEFFAILTALLWAFGVIYFKRSGEHVSAFTMCLFKNVWAAGLLFLTAWMLPGGWPEHVTRADFRTLIVSGVIGIGASDTLFLFSLNRLGASRTALVDCLYSPFVILVSFVFLNETLGVWDLVGAALIISSVLLSARSDFGEAIPRKTYLVGVLAGASAMLTLVIAIILIKPLLSVYPLAWLSGLRMLGGLAALLVVLPFHPGRRKVLDAFRPQAHWRFLLPATLLSSYFSLLAWVAGLKHTQTNIAAILNQLSTVLVVLLAVVFLRERLTKLKLLAVGLGVTGAVLVFLK